MSRLAEDDFARAALQSGCRFSAGLAEARALMATGRPEQAERLLVTLAAPNDRAAVTLALVRARNLFWALDRPAQAEAVLRGAARSSGATAQDTLRGTPESSSAAARDPLRGTPESSSAAELDALRARFAFALGDPCAALAIAAPVESCDAAPEAARVRAAVTLAEALAVCGRFDEALAVARRWAPAAECELAAAGALAHWLAGNLLDAAAEAERAYATAANPQNSAAAALLLGHVWLSRGHVETALRWFRESSALLRGSDPVGMRPAALAGIAQAAAQAGDAAHARAALEALEGSGGELGLARAWTAKVCGDHHRALELATGVMTTAEARGAHGFAARVRHELHRLAP